MKNKNQTVLVSTLGEKAPVISETLNVLIKKRKKKIDRLYVIHTSSEFVIKGPDRFEAFKKWLKKNYKDIELIPKCFEKDDIKTESDNKELLDIILNIALEEKSKGNRILFSIAGGRKTMSAIALFAAYIVGADGIFHIIIKGDERAVLNKEENKNKPFDIPVKDLDLIDIPVIDLSKIFSNVLYDIDRENKYNGDIHSYLKAQKSYTEAFDSINNQLSKAHNIRKLKEKYESRYPLYEKMCFLIETLIKVNAKKSNLPVPSVTTRVKTFPSFLEKIYRKQEEYNKRIDDPFNSEHIRDMAGIRVIYQFKKDEKKYADMIKNIKDFDSVNEEPIINKFGYCAYHIDVKLDKNSPRLKLDEFQDLKDIACEIQIKSSFDNAAQTTDHRLRYKSDIYNDLKPEEQEEIFDTIKVMYSQTENLNKIFDDIKKYYKNKT